jgi:Sulfotransferase family
VSHRATWGSDHEGAVQKRALPAEPECPPSWTTAPPDFVGIGAQRCGTTWWFAGALEAHPLVAIPPGRRKELHFFDRYWTDEVETDFAARYEQFFPRPEGSITGEWTPSYMCDPWAVPLLVEASPEARFLIMLRDPVERYRSGIAPVLRRSREHGYDPLSIVIANHAVLHSMYHAQVKRALEILGRDRVLVLQYERCVDDPLGQMRRTQRFLELEPLAAVPPALERRVPSGTLFPLGESPPLPARLRLELTSALGDDVREVAALCPELDLGLWPNFASL